MHALGCQGTHHATAQVWLQAGLFSEHPSSLCAQALQTGFWAEALLCSGVPQAPAVSLLPMPTPQTPGGGSSLARGSSCLVLSVSQAECFSCHLMRRSWSMSASPPAAARRLRAAWEVAAAISAGWWRGPFGSPRVHLPVLAHCPCLSPALLPRGAQLLLPDSRCWGCR